MIISHKYKYIFVELPRTGTTAISKKLVNDFAGESILIKHASLKNFKKIYKDQYKDYFVFSCIRNPLDRTVSLYEKLMKETLYGENYKSKNIFSLKNIYYSGRLKFLKSNKSFEEYFLKFYKLPYDDWSSLDHLKMNYIIRFEHLQADFEKVLNQLNISVEESHIPIVNKTKDKKQYLEYFNSHKIKKRACFVFGSFCEKFDYELPFDCNNSLMSRALYKTLSPIRNFIWINVKSSAINKKLKR